MISFVLVSSGHGTLIVNRNDWSNATDYHGVGLKLFETGEYVPQEINGIKECLKLRRKYYGDGVVMIDCGANIGVHTIECARLMQGWGEVLSFEPQRMVYYALCGNIAINNLKNVTAVMHAVGNKCGRIPVPQLDPDHHASFGDLELKGENHRIGLDVKKLPIEIVDLVTIDSVVADNRVDFIKIDVQGMEFEVLEGVIDTVKRCQPMLMIEHEKYLHDKIISWLDDLDYISVGNDAGWSSLAVPKSAPYVKAMGAT